MKRIVFICTGNICRSAMAHYYMQKRLYDLNLQDEYIIESAGINANTGDKATNFAIKAIKKYGADASKHVATNIEDSNIDKSDLIMCMTQSHKRRILEIYPKLKNKIYTLKEYIGENNYLDIDDPWGLSLEVYRACAEEIVKCVDKLLKKISRGE